jgi:integrase
VPGLTGKGGEDGRRGHAIGSKFSRLKREWGFDAALNMHGLRRAVATRMESARVAQHVAEVVLGHARRSESFGTYSKGADLPVLAAAVESIDYSEAG